ncbi:MAG: capsule assembly Wzi family protein [Tannerella sp.]|nr:capsule assembly Wzi family protein [Tannerella sp.]
MRHPGWFLIVQCLCVLPFFEGYAQSLAETGGGGGPERTATEPLDCTLYNISTSASFSTGGQTPFWMVSNRYGLVPLKANNGYLQAQVYHYQPLGGKFSLHAGIDMVAATPRYRNVYVQQLFAEVAYGRLLHLSVGSRGNVDYEADYHASLPDASLSSGDMVLSPNARPIPEINIYAPRFLPVPWTNDWLQIRGNFAVGRSFDTDYLTSFVRTKQNYNRDVLWHHKSVYVRMKDMKGHFPFSMTVGIRHVAQWGGVSTSPAAGVQPHSLKDFVRVVVGQSGGSDATASDQINVLGNHYGTYDFGLGYERPEASLLVYYQHFFDDASGMEFYNGLDGLMGVQLNLHRRGALNRVLVERLYTLNQSGPFHFIDFDHDRYPGYGGGGDNYYNNGEYVTGASYFNRSTGSPLLISPEYNRSGELGFRHNRIVAWYAGAEGDLAGNVSYRLRCSTVESRGTPYAPTLKKLHAHSLAATVTYRCRSAWLFSVTLAGDRGDLLGDHVGIGFSVARRGFLRE